MKNTGRLLGVVVPILVVLGLCAFLIVRKQFDGIAPTPPVSTIPEPTTTPVVPRTAKLEPTVLAPEPSDDGSLPPGVEPDDIGPAIILPNDASSEGVIPIPDLQQPTTLLEFPPSTDN